MKIYITAFTAAFLVLIAFLLPACSSRDDEPVLGETYNSGTTAVVLGQSDNICTSDIDQNEYSSGAEYLASLVNASAPNDLVLILSDPAEDMYPSGLDVCRIPKETVSGEYILIAAVCDGVNISITNGGFDSRLEWVADEICEEAYLNCGEAFLAVLSVDKEIMLTAECGEKKAQVLLECGESGDTAYLSYVGAAETDLPPGEASVIGADNVYAVDIAAAAALTEYFSGGDITAGSNAFGWDTLGWYAAIQAISGKEAVLHAEDASLLLSALPGKYSSEPPEESDIIRRADYWEFSSYADRLYEAMCSDLSFMPVGGEKSIIILVDIFKCGFTYSRDMYTVAFANDPKDISKTIKVRSVSHVKGVLSTTAIEAVYTNNAYGFKFGVPSGFALVPSDNTGMSKLTDSSAGMSILLFCEDMMLEYSPAERMEKIASELDTAPEAAESGEDGYILLYESDGVIYYRKSVIDGTREITALYSCTAPGSEDFGAVIRGSEGTLVIS